MAEELKKPADTSFAVTKTEQYRTAGELIERSRPNATYYVLLAISSLIISAGLLLGNATIVIGGMLVTPVLTPLLAIALGLAVGEMRIMRDTSILLVKSFVIVLVFSLVMSIIMGNGQPTFNFENNIRAAILYFVVALASGAAATVAWARKEVSDVLPGVAIAVSLVPPVSLMGIWLSQLNAGAARFYFSVFLLNLFGVIIGSLVVFSLLRFYQSGDRIHKKVEAVVAADRQEKEKED